MQEVGGSIPPGSTKPLTDPVDSMDRVDCVVVGGGVIGLAIARALLRDRRSVLVLEAEASFGTGISARNSEVIHAGIYYPPGSLKAGLCTAGRELLYDFCERHGVPHRRCGKVLVATSGSQLPQLEGVREIAGRNGVVLQPLDRNRLRELVPEISAEAGLFSPGTGIVDSHAYMLALAGQVESTGGIIACRSRVSRMWLREDGIAIAVNDAEPQLLAGAVINCAGLQAPAVARLIDGFAQQRIPAAHLAKGSYFVLEGRSPFRHLVYPLPEPGGLGIHLTVDLAGRARFGPDVEWVSGVDYAVDESRAQSFYAAVRKYWPGLPDGGLRPGYAGIRPKISAPGAPAADFRIDPPDADGRVFNLFGIESPGLTASLAIADYVEQLLHRAGR